MAESAKPAPKPAAPPPVPEAPAAPVETIPPPPPSASKQAYDRFKRQMAKLMTTTFWFSVGLGLIFLGTLEHFQLFIHNISVRFHLPFAHLHLPYLIVGMGFWSLGHARDYIRADYMAQRKKNKQFPHTWKIPLIIGQVLILQIIGIYGVLVGFNAFPPLNSLIGSTFLLVIFLAYVLWYVIEEFRNRFPSVAGLRVSLVALTLGVGSEILWTLEFPFFSMLLGFFSIVSVISALAIKDSPEQYGRYAKIAALLGSIFFVAYVGYNSLALGTPTAELMGKGLAVKDLAGTIDRMAYAPSTVPLRPVTPSHKLPITPPNGEKIAFSQKTKEGWFLQVVDPGNATLTAFKIPAGEDSFRPLFVDSGKSVVLDAVRGGERGIWKVNSTTGIVRELKKGDVQAFGDGVLWSEMTKQLLYVSKPGDRYELNALTLDNGKSKVLMKSEHPILSPSWTRDASQVAYVDGIHGYNFMLDVKTGVSEQLVSGEERAQRINYDGTPAITVIPAPDHFRCLYVTKTEKTMAIWSVLMDGSKRKQHYATKGTISQVTWTPDAQQIVFEEKVRRNGFSIQTKGIRILNANLDKAVDLIIPHVPVHSPAVSFDGVKVAFVATQGLWYRLPDFINENQGGIWVALLR